MTGTSEADEATRLRVQTGLPVDGVFAFGDDPAFQDELLGFVRTGTKRATVGLAPAAGDRGTRARVPQVGRYWGLLDGSGRARFVMQTAQVALGRLGDVTPAFAWDEGEYDRSVASWLDVHRRFFRRLGCDRPDDLMVHFERFRIAWPRRDGVTWLTGDVRELDWDEREDHTLPALARITGGGRAGVLVFRPLAGGQLTCVRIHLRAGGHRTCTALIAGFIELGRRHGYGHVTPVCEHQLPPARAGGARDR